MSEYPIPSESANTKSESARLRDVLTMLKENYQRIDAASDALDTKAWQILGLLVAVIGIALPILLQIGQPTSNPAPQVSDFTAGIVISLASSFFCFVACLMVVRPRRYSLPGGGDSISDAAELERKYVEVGDLASLRAQIVDYAGINRSGKYIPGCIADIMRRNDDKSALILIAQVTLYLTASAVIVDMFLV